MGQHDSVFYHTGLLYRANDIAGTYLITRLNAGFERPAPLPIEPYHRYAPLDAITEMISQGRQWPLNTVKDGLQQARTELGRQRLPRRDYRSTGSQTCRLFIYLDTYLIPANLNNLSDQARLAHAAHVVHPRLGKAFSNDKRSGDFHNPATHVHSSFPGKMSTPTAFSAARRIFSMPIPRLP